MKKTIEFVDAAKHKAVIEYQIELPKISHWKYPHKGAEKKQLVPYNQEQFMPKFAASGDYGNGCGQCLDNIMPTKKQNLLINFWRLHHLKDIYPEQIKVLDKIVKDIEDEEAERKEQLFQQTEWDVYDDEQEDLIINWILDNTDAEDRDEAYKYLALAREGYIEVAEIANIHKAEYNEHIYQMQGIDYYAGTEDELEELAMERLTEDDSLWIQAVQAHETTQGLDDWAQEVLDMDGATSVLNTYDGKQCEYDFCDPHQESIIVCRA